VCRYIATLLYCFTTFCLSDVPPAVAQPSAVPNTVFLEELTWPEVRDALQGGKTTIIFPTGGTEQNGPHMALGKHNVIVKYAAERIARQLGNALVAPVLAYVPEGELTPTGHMRFPGTITLPSAYFMKVTEFAARSFKLHGFKDIVLLGDSGGNQAGLRAVAETLNQEWAHSDVRVHFVADYYTSGYATSGDFANWLRSQGETPADIGQHAGILDTSQLLAIAPGLIRSDKLAAAGTNETTGVSGNPKRASVAYGRKGLELRISAAVAQIRHLLATAKRPK
jgi:creatinine amidohydrolase/Fe(II)-dependent formamide hydrolase-like protein